VLLGDELDSPRGRIYLIKDMLENDKPASEQVVKHVDRCLSCLSCMTTCPSGVHYMHLVDHARKHIEATYKRPLADRWLRPSRRASCTSSTSRAGRRRARWPSSARA
jgi:glycolate oxidase iron-sulfur subunit